MTLVTGSIAGNRFGLGMRADEVPPDDPRRWLLDQFNLYQVRPAVFATVAPVEPLLRQYSEATMQRREARRTAGAPASPLPMAPTSIGVPAMMAKPAATKTVLPDEVADAVAAAARARRERYRAAVSARMTNALTTPAPFVERLVSFWSNHFAISSDKPELEMLAFDFEAEAIRPHVLGRFADLLLAVEQHPAMLVYLDQTSSIGPDSVQAQRQAAADAVRRRGLNENLAREIMELHTLGVRTGYSQADVTEFARAMTGWNVAGLRANDLAPLGFQFHAAQHEPGTRTIMGRAYPAGGEEQARAVLLDFAASSATARHLAIKLARHFVADDPPPALVDRLATTFLRSGGDLPTVYRTLIEAREAWSPRPAKFKTPWDWSVSALRALGSKDVGQLDAAHMLTQLGQQVWKPGQPSGYDDIAASWAAPDALMRRVELAQRLAATAGPDIDARTLAPRILGGTLTPATATALAQAESAPTALALLLVSPEFQRR